MTMVLTCSHVVVWDMAVTRLIKNLCRRLIKQGRKVNSNRITTREVITGRRHVGSLPKIVRELVLRGLKKLSDRYGED
jgi:hypothetical protein